MSWSNYPNSDPNVSLVLTPTENINGTTTITLKLGDGNGFVTHDITIEIVSQNDAPIAQDDSFRFVEDTALVIDMDEAIVNDTDVDAGDTLSLYAVDTGSISAGSLTLLDAQAHTYTYNPPANQSATATF